MSRNGSGTMSVVNTFVASTRVLSADVNENFSDIASEITNSLAIDGQSSMGGQFKGYSGLIGAPGWSWASETASGFYRAGAGDFRFSVSGADVFKLTSTGPAAPSGTVGSPGLSWTADATSGWYRAGSGDFRYSVSGADAIKVTSAGVESSNTFIVRNSGAGAVYLRNLAGVNQINSYNAAVSATAALNLNASVYTFQIADTEKMQLDASGRLLVNTSTSIAAATDARVQIAYSKNSEYAIIVRPNDNNTGGGGSFVFQNLAGGVIGSITHDATTTSYNTGSDYRLKDISGPLIGSGAYIDSLNPVEGTWKADGSIFVGLIAHEAQASSRTRVATGEKDGAATQAMAYASPEIIANIIAELQSLRARVATLEARP